MMCVSVAVFSQSSNGLYIHQFLTTENSCKTGAVTDRGGYVVVTAENKIAYTTGIPLSLVTCFNEWEGDIWDICLTESGSWFIVGNNLRGEGCPQAMMSEIDNFLDQGDTVISVTFNDYGEWIVITDNHFSASNQQLRQLLEKTNNTYGFIRSASMTNNNAIVVGKGGIMTLQPIPRELDKYLSTMQTFDIQLIKFSDGGAYLVTDGENAAHYNLY
jgi:hypothetical protein